MSEVERICNQFKFQLEESREECQRKMLEMEEKLKLSKEVEEKWRRQSLEAVARCEFEEARS